MHHARFLTPLFIPSSPHTLAASTGWLLDDLYSFDPATMVWTMLLAAGSVRPSARSFHGFTSAGGKLYVHGGQISELNQFYVQHTGTHSCKMTPRAYLYSYWYMIEKIGRISHEIWRENPQVFIYLDCFFYFIASCIFSPKDELKSLSSESFTWITFESKLKVFMYLLFSEQAFGANNMILALLIFPALSDILSLDSFWFIC